MDWIPHSTTTYLYLFTYKLVDTQTKNIQAGTVRQTDGETDRLRHPNKQTKQADRQIDRQVGTK